MRWAGHAACIDVIRKVRTVLVREPEGKGHLRRHRLVGEGVGLGMEPAVGLGMDPAAGFGDHGSGSSGIIKHGAIHRPGDDCQECDRRACAGCLGQSRVVIVRS
jgi:hypothetical protein